MEIVKCERTSHSKRFQNCGWRTDRMCEFCLLMYLTICAKLNGAAAAAAPRLPLSLFYSYIVT